MKFSELKIDWQKVDNLLPVIVQDVATSEILMMAYMNKEALELSFKTGTAHYFSRSKNRIWKKGESSANVQILKSAFIDCDNDTLLLKVEQKGSACHTGHKSCFFSEISLGENSLEISDENLDKISKPHYEILDEIYHICLDRKFNANPENSYVAKLYSKGENAYLKKIAEEASEFILACKDLRKSKIYAELNRENFGEHKAGEPEYDAIYEGADLIFHMIVALADHDIHPENLLNELARREGISGITEKNSRKS